MAVRRATAWAALVSLALLCAMLLPAAATAISGAEIVQRLNAQREANGIPGGVVERPDWSADCAKHNYYGAQSGELRHSEDPGSPYYSAEGNWAAENSVLAGGSSWSHGNPWEEAPIHLIQLLAPQLSEMGAAENNNHNCATTWPGYQRPEPVGLTGYSYPGNGVSGVVPSERASESPFVPGDQVGLPEGTLTGRYLLAYLAGLDPSDAPDVTATATLSGAEGAVDLRVVDSTNEEVGGYMPQPSAFLIPAQPLKPLSAYQADVTWSMEGAVLYEQRFGFTTGADSAEGVVPIRRKRAARCRNYSRAAHKLRHRAARAHRRGHLRRWRHLKRLAGHKGRQARRCRGRIRPS